MFLLMDMIGLVHELPPLSRIPELGALLLEARDHGISFFGQNIVTDWKAIGTNYVCTITK